MQEIRCVLFDLDGTLSDGGPLRSALTATCDALALRYPALDPNVLLAANDGVWATYWPEVQDEWTLGQLTGASVRAEAWRRTLAECAPVDDGAAAFAESTHQRLERGAQLLYDDVAPTLSALADRGIAMGMVSNGAADTQREKIAHFDLGTYFGAVVLSGEEGIAKPAPEIFDTALSLLDANAATTCHIGDSLASDVAGANAAGLMSVWLNRAGRRRAPDEAEPDAEIHTLDALVDLLTR